VKCDAARQTIIDIYKIQNISKITVIPDGNYIDAYLNEVTKKEAREYLDLGTEFVYLFFGQIRPYKGVNQLIDSFKQIQTGEEIVYIAGNPSTSDIERDIQSSAGEDTQIRTDLKYIPDENIQYYMNAADVLVLPYKDILNSGSVYLGLSFGMPIIAPEIGCIPSIMPQTTDLLYDLDRESLKNTLRTSSNVDLHNERNHNLSRGKELTWRKSAEHLSNIYMR
jgi:Glycosyltransferase